MTLWLVFALMTAVAIFAVLWPLSRRTGKSGGSDILVYRDQLAEVERDRATGLIGAAEAEAARVEVSRRLIAAADAAEAAKAAEAQTATVEVSPRWRRRAIAIVGLVVLPAGAVGLYLLLGSPQMPGEPLAARLTAPSENRSVEALIAQVEDHVQRNPNDGRAWEVLAPVYMQIGRYDDAARAWQNVIALNGSSADREANSGEAMVAAANGVVTADAKAAFERALARDKTNVMARFYMGMAADQDGRRADAEKIWRDLLASAPPGASWVEFVQHALARNAPPGGAAIAAAPAAAPGSSPSATDTAAATPTPAPAQQDNSVDGMVARLAARLKKDGSDVRGWVQLVRSYRVLGQADKAQGALADAKTALAGDADKLRQLAEGTEGAAANAKPDIPMASAAAPAAPMAAATPAPAPAEQDNSAEGMVARLAARLKKDGSDVRGWVQLVRSYRVLGQADKAQGALAEAKAALAGDADKLRQLAEGAEGAAANAKPNIPMASAVPPAVPMAPSAGAASPGAPGPTAADVAAAAKLDPGQQNAMIATMVARLADRLKTDGSDFDGWQRLIRAYVVLGERNKAQSAASDARKALAGDADKLQRIEDVIKGLKVEN